MSVTFEDVLGKIKHHAQFKEQGYGIPMMPKFNERVGNITQGLYSVVAGLPSAGTTSFVDQNYVMNTLIQWYYSDARKPLKVFYFSMIDDELKKLQSLLCCYLRLICTVCADVPSLNSQPGRKFDIDSDAKVINGIAFSKPFFNDIIEEEILTIIDGAKSPSAIYNTVTEYYNGIGIDKPGSPYEINDGYEDLTVLVVVDKTDHLAPEVDEFSGTYGNDLNVKFDHNMKKLSSRYKATPTIIVPAQPGLVRTPKDTEPHYKQLGVYGKSCHRGIILYNPIAEKNVNRFLSSPDDLDCFLLNGKNVLRYWSIVRNSDGVDNDRNRILFLPGSSFMVEYEENIEANGDDIWKILTETDTSYTELIN